MISCTIRVSTKFHGSAKSESSWRRAVCSYRCSWYEY